MAAALPLSPAFATGSTGLAVVGPQARDWRILMGAVNYAFADGPSKGVVTLLDGIAAAVANASASGGAAAAAAAGVTHVDGCSTTACPDDSGFAAAAKAAAAASEGTVVVLGNWFGAVSGWPLCNGDGTDGCESECHDRTAIELPGKQVELVLKLRAAIDGSAPAAPAPSGASSGSKPPLVCVLLHGGAVALGDALGACDAVLDMWVPGQMGGAALADVLFGAHSPAGRAPVTFYHATSDLPPMDLHQFDEYPTAGKSNGTTYRHFVGAAPDFAFGHGTPTSVSMIALPD